MYFHYHRSCDPDVHLWVKFSQGFENLIFFGFYKMDQIPVFGETGVAHTQLNGRFEVIILNQISSFIRIPVIEQKENFFQGIPILRDFVHLGPIFFQNLIGRFNNMHQGHLPNNQLILLIQ